MIEVTGIQKLTNFFILFLSIWALYIIVASLFDVNIIFPFTISEGGELPYDKLIIIKLTVFATFSFYGLMHFLNTSKEVYPIHFLKTFLFMLSIMWLVSLFKEGSEPVLKDWLLVLFLFFSVASAFHLVSRQYFKRYFAEK